MPETVSEGLSGGRRSPLWGLGNSGLHDRNQATNLLLARNGQLPGFKLGSGWYMRRSTFLSHIEQFELARNTRQP